MPDIQCSLAFKICDLTSLLCLSMTSVTLIYRFHTPPSYKGLIIKKIKNEAQLLKKALSVAERYAVNRGYNAFSATDSAKQKVESLYRLLVHDKLISPLPADKEDLASLKRRLVMWIIKQLPEDHDLLK